MQYKTRIIQFIFITCIYGNLLGTNEQYPTVCYTTTQPKQRTEVELNRTENSDVTICTRTVTNPTMRTTYEIAQHNKSENSYHFEKTITENGKNHDEETGTQTSHLTFDHLKSAYTNELGRQRMIAKNTLTALEEQTPRITEQTLGELTYLVFKANGVSTYTSDRICFQIAISIDQSKTWPLLDEYAHTIHLLATQKQKEQKIRSHNCVKHKKQPEELLC